MAQVEYGTVLRNGNHFLHWQNYCEHMLKILKEVEKVKKNYLYCYITVALFAEALTFINTIRYISRSSVADPRDIFFPGSEFFHPRSPIWIRKKEFKYV